MEAGMDSHPITVAADANRIVCNGRGNRPSSASENRQ
jgi:hypothetical protein